MGKRPLRKRRQPDAPVAGGAYNSVPPDPPARLLAQGSDGNLIAVAYGTSLRVYDIRSIPPFFLSSMSIVAVQQLLHTQQLRQCNSCCILSNCNNATSAM